VGYHLYSADGIHDWKDNGYAWSPRDYQKIFCYEGSTTCNKWYKMERPGVVLEDGHPTHITWAVADVDKDNQIPAGSNHGSKVIVVPFDGTAFDTDFGSGGTGGTGGSGGTGGAGSGGRSGSGGTGTGGLATGGAASGGRATGGTGTGGSATGGLASGGRATGGTISMTGGTTSTTGGTAISGGTTSVGGTGGGNPEQDCNCRTAPSQDGYGKLFGFVGLCLLAARRRRARR
jgi:MYXO-CTERM domain-containing protein